MTLISLSLQKLGYKGEHVIDDTDEHTQTEAHNKYSEPKQLSVSAGVLWNHKDLGSAL